MGVFWLYSFLGGLKDENTLTNRTKNTRKNCNKTNSWKIRVETDTKNTERQSASIHFPTLRRNNKKFTTHASHSHTAEEEEEIE